MQFHQLFLFLLLLLPILLLFARHERKAAAERNTGDEQQPPKEPPQDAHAAERAHLIELRRNYLQLGKLIESDLATCEEKRKPVLLRQKISIDKTVFNIDKKLGYM